MMGLERIIKVWFVLAVRSYQWGISPFIPARCRYLPTCSEYAIEAIHVHGACTGARLALQRLARCHPFGGHGLDPVPAKPATDACANPVDITMSKSCHDESELASQPVKPE